MNSFWLLWCDAIFLNKEKIYIHKAVWFALRLMLKVYEIIDYTMHMEHTIVIWGNGQELLLLAVNILLVVQDSFTAQSPESWHHPQSSDNKYDTDKHDEHTPAKAEQSYNITVDDNAMNKNICYAYKLYQLEGLHQSLNNMSHPVHSITHSH